MGNTCKQVKARALYYHRERLLRCDVEWAPNVYTGVDTDLIVQPSRDNSETRADWTTYSLHLLKAKSYRFVLSIT